MEARVFGFVYDAHSTAAEFFKNMVVRKSLTNKRWRLGHLPHMVGKKRS